MEEFCFEQVFCWVYWVGGVDDDDVEVVCFVFLYEFYVVFEVQFCLCVVVGFVQFGEIFFGKMCYLFVDIDLYGVGYFVVV